MTALSEIFKQAYAKADTAHHGDNLDAARKAQLTTLKNTMDAISRSGVCNAELRAHSMDMYIIASFGDRSPFKILDVDFGSRHGNPTLILTRGKDTAPLGGDESGYDLASVTEQKALVSDIATVMAEHFSKFAIKSNAVNFIKNNL